MCYFVLVAFAQEASPVARRLLRSAYHLRETTNPSLLADLPAGWCAGYLADEMCGCGMYSDPQSGEKAVSIDDRIQRFRERHSKARHRKRGWTDRKIERAVQQMRDDDERQPKNDLRGIRIDVRRAIAEFVRSAGPVRTIVHFFSRGIDEEEIASTFSKVLHAEQFLADESLVGPDVWYEIRQKAT